jgi:hypothetical protein
MTSCASSISLWTIGSKECELIGEVSFILKSKLYDNGSETNSLYFRMKEVISMHRLIESLRNFEPTIRAMQNATRVHEICLRNFGHIIEAQKKIKKNTGLAA